MGGGLRRIVWLCAAKKDPCQGREARSLPLTGVFFCGSFPLATIRRWARRDKGATPARRRLLRFMQGMGKRADFVILAY